MAMVNEQGQLIIQTVDGITMDWGAFWGADALAGSQEMLDKYSDSIMAIGGVFQTAFSETGGMKDALKQTLNLLIDFAEKQLLVASAVATLRGVFGDIGGLIALGGAVALLEIARGAVNSFQGGIDYVPRDGVKAMLHKGERVLTKQQAEDYRSGQGGKTDVLVHFSRFESVIEDSHIRRGRRYS
jgi:hypothetical protein